MVQAFVIAGTHSGSGKTTISVGLMAALQRQGYVVQPFKVGPDYIDPGFHTKACKRNSYNLDAWMMGEEGVQETFSSQIKGADIAIVEGVMGLFDGRDDKDGTSSTAHVAQILGLPVVLVVDAKSMAQSAGAVVYGFENYSSEINIAGVIFNRVGSESHYRMLQREVESRCKAKVLGYIPKNTALSIPERHLGLVSSKEHKKLDRIIEELAETIASHIDIEKLRKAVGSSHSSSIFDSTSLDASSKKLSRVRIAVAMDHAFWFYYHENLDILKDWGAEIVFFSPLNDTTLPHDIDGIYLGGGYPELHARRLSENKLMIEAIREWATKDGVLYAECGGFMYLTEGTYDFRGRFFEMAGVFKTRSKMIEKGLRLGYREVEFLGETVLGKRGSKARGHEFHYSTLVSPPENARPVYKLSDSIFEGYKVGNTLSSYIHIHFRSNKEIGKNFVEFCQKRGKMT